MWRFSAEGKSTVNIDNEAKNLTFPKTYIIILSSSEGGTQLPSSMGEVMALLDPPLSKLLSMDLLLIIFTNVALKKLRELTDSSLISASFVNVGIQIQIQIQIYLNQFHVEQ